MALIEISKKTDAKLLERIATALEKLVVLYEAETSAMGVFAAPTVKVKDPIEAEDVDYSNPEEEYIREFKERYKLLSDEEKEAFKHLQEHTE